MNALPDDITFLILFAIFCYTMIRMWDSPWPTSHIYESQSKRRSLPGPVILRPSRKKPHCLFSRKVQL